MGLYDRPVYASNRLQAIQTLKGVEPSNAEESQDRC